MKRAFIDLEPLSPRKAPRLLDQLAERVQTGQVPLRLALDVASLCGVRVLRHRLEAHVRQVLNDEADELDQAIRFFDKQGPRQ